MLPAEHQYEVPAAPSATPWTARHVRLVGLLVAGPAAVVLALAAWVHPSPRGYDTHTQLGLSACSLIQTTGMPCPTCGMTTAFAHMARGQVVEALQAQAFGAVLFVLMLAAALAGTAQALGGRDHFGAAPLRPRMWWLWALLAGGTAGWALKMALGLWSGALPAR